MNPLSSSTTHRSTPVIGIAPAMMNTCGICFVSTVADRSSRHCISDAPLRSSATNLACAS